MVVIISLFKGVDDLCPIDFELLANLFDGVVVDQSDIYVAVGEQVPAEERSQHEVRVTQSLYLNHFSASFLTFR